MNKNREKNIGLYNLVKILMGIALVTSSFDLILTLKLKDNTIRLSQVCIVAAAVGFAVIAFKNKEMKLPIGWKELLCLLAINGMFCFNSDTIARNIGYEIWFVINVLLVIIAVNMFDTDKLKKNLVKLWALSSVGISLFAIVQFLVGLLGISLLTEQWTRPFLPRLNGFCREPSYLACYLLPFWVFFAYVYENKEETLFKSKLNLVCYIIISIAIIFSTSRMGLLMVGAWLCFRLLVVLFNKKNSHIKNLIVLCAVVALSFLCIVKITSWSNPLYEMNSAASGENIGGVEGENIGGAEGEIIGGA
ncbi:MAG: hypothetical protein RR315_08050, partial [Oscillospiraceae bacterium]